jgi:hypothetical protein
VFILEHSIALQLFAAVHEAFSIAYPENEVLNKMTMR